MDLPRVFFRLVSYGDVGIWAQFSVSNAADMTALNLTTLTLPHFPPDSHSVHIAVLKDIQNAEHLRSQLLAGNADYEYAFIDARNV